MDQGQHFGSIGAAATGAQMGDAGMEFRESFDETERERRYCSVFPSDPTNFRKSLHFGPRRYPIYKKMV